MKVINNRRTLQGAVQKLRTHEYLWSTYRVHRWGPVEKISKYIKSSVLRGQHSHISAIDTRPNVWSLEKQSTGVGSKSCGSWMI